MPDTRTHAALRAHAAALAVRVTALRFLLKAYNPNQPRVPAGSSDGGQWTGGGSEPTPAHHVGRIIRVAAGGDEHHFWIGNTTIPHHGFDPLDPRGLNEALAPEEGAAITNSLDIIDHGTKSQLRKLSPHRYQNFPNIETGAQLPYSLDGYMSYDVWPFRADRRLYIDQFRGLIYYSNNHGKSYRRILKAPNVKR